ncbi:PepSY domain-containing protein [Jeotgalibacillus sp. S-D1]|uniref:PepSY-associated TM helix domain-containing protein n=1 Tax=Jeotgalibacillus sp. S-D1 TaxID=2552189 RepID=UPI00105A1D3B|nr:PepSY domain-containing protein [Jeotgalibacillus sp. S-D1]TDL32785.1 PepSY domain-containing protein [Jeotgalibacillus sp. S-D1]
MEDKRESNHNDDHARYRSVWRWHFYAGLFVTPFLVILAVTGGIYLFKPQIEASLYKDYYEVEASWERQAASEQLALVRAEYPEAAITTYRPGEDEARSSEVGIATEEGSATVFVDPYKNEIIGDLNADDRIMNKLEEIHGELMAGTVGDRIVELAASWTIVLVVTGLFLWFPRKKRPYGSFLPKRKANKSVRRRDLHAIPAFWIAGGMFFLIITGLPWSGFWGNNFQLLATNTGVGYPPSTWLGSAPESITKTEDIADVPWAAEKMEVPESEVVQGFVPLNVDEMVEIAEQQNIHPTYTISLPAEKTGVVTLSAYPPRAQDEFTIHLDQYSGAVLADYRFDNYGTVAQAVAMGITLHKGSQFGLPNQLFSLLICMGIVFVALSGFYLWYKRKPNRGMGAPKGLSARKVRWFFIALIILGLIFPLVGVSLLVVWVIDRFLIQRIPPLKKFLNA